MSDTDKLERLKSERLKAEREARQAAERERLAVQQAEERAAFDKRAKLWDEHEESIRTFAEPPSEPVVLPISEGVGRMADDLRQGWTAEPPSEPDGELRYDDWPETCDNARWTVQPPVRPSRNVANRLWDLVAAVKEIVAMDGEPDWRGLLTEALEDAAT